MMKFRHTAIAALAITGAGLIPAQVEAQSTQDIIETVGAMILADRLGIDPNLILMSKLGGGSVFDMAPALALGAYGNNDLGSILAMQNAGYGYGDIAGYNSVPQPVYVNLQRTRSLDSDYVWADEFSNRYSVGQERLYALRRAGYNWHEIAQAMVESQETGQSLEDALYENRVFGVSREPVYYDPYQPVYVPPRRTRYVSVLPAPRTDWSYYGSAFEPVPTIWATRTVRPVVTRWSPVRMVRQPMFVYDDGRFRQVQQPLYVMREPVRVVSTGRVRFAPTRFVYNERVYVRPTITRYAVREVSTSGGRAQPFGMVRREEAWKNQERAHARRDARALAREERKDDIREQRQRVDDRRRDENRRLANERRQEARKVEVRRDREERQVRARAKSEDARKQRLERAQKARSEQSKRRAEDRKVRTERAQKARVDQSKRRDEVRKQRTERAEKRRSETRKQRVERPKRNAEVRVRASGNQKRFEQRADVRANRVKARSSVKLSGGNEGRQRGGSKSKGGRGKGG